MKYGDMYKMEKTESKCTLSIIVPVYNVSEWLETCLNSILAQTWQNFELICVDDGSTDNSLEILHHYRGVDGRVKVIHKENGGLVSARKAGVQQAEGMYIGCVDSDDWIDPDLFKCLMEKAIQYNADIVTSGCVREYGSGSVVHREEMSAGFYEKEKLLHEFLPNMIGDRDFFCQRILAAVWGKVFKAELYKKYQMLVPDECTIGEDQACTFPILLNSEKIYVLGKEMYHYRQRETSMCGTGDRSLEVYRPAISYMYQYFQSVSHSEYIEQFSRMALHTMLYLAPEQVWKYQKSVPFHTLPEGKVLLYGIGRFGRALSTMLKQENGIQIVAYLDKTPRDMNDGLPCYSLQELKNTGLEYDYIIVSVLHAYAWKEIRQQLLTFGISEEKIICPCVKSAKEIIAKMV